MKGLFSLLFMYWVVAKPSIALPTDEVLVALAYTEGVGIYNTCIAVPPIDPHQIAYCTTLYLTYISTLSLVNAPYPISPSSDPSPYQLSPYDICKYETTHMVFNSVIEAPYYCPTI